MRLRHQFRHQTSSAEAPVYRSSSPHRRHESLAGDSMREKTKTSLGGPQTANESGMRGGEERRGGRKMGQTRLDVKNLVLSRGAAEPLHNTPG